MEPLNTYFADVIVPLSVPNRYTYRVPAELSEHVKAGKRVLVQFGKSKLYTGIVYRIHQNAPKDYTAKYIETLLDEHPVLSPLQLSFWDWMSFYYCAHPGEVMNAALPAGLKLSSTSHLQLHPDYNFEESSHGDFTEREHQVLDALHTKDTLSFEELSAILKVKSVQATVSKLLKKNAVLIYEDIKDRYKPKLQQVVMLSEEYHSDAKLQALLKQLENRAFKQLEVVLHYLQLQKGDFPSSFEWKDASEIGKRADGSALKSLIKKGVFKHKEIEVGRLLYQSATQKAKELSPRQSVALSEIKTAFAENKPVLFSGVTGSGKTEIYIRLIQEALDRNEQVLYLLPEIALTTQLITRLRAVFGEAVGVYHSRFSENERVEIWNKVLNWPGEIHLPEGPKPYQIILGARSSLLLPFHHLGLIIVDEEHDSSFKQRDPAPRYQARDSALYLAQLHKSNILLGSATPSVESYYNAELGKYKLVELPEQYASGGGTLTEICDLNYYRQTRQMKASISKPLFESIELALQKKEQVILFQNRRGFAPYTECRDCGHVPHCVQCDVSLIYHKQSDKLSCHYCGYSVLPPKTCSACGSQNLHYRGIGTEKIEEDVEILFPNAKIARMDLDSTRNKYAYKQLIDDFETGNTDILVGTQMVTKGLDFKNVSVVGILDADGLLNFPDFRSFERAFQMITQVRGRAGRGHEKGRVFIQTNQPEHQVLGFVLQNDFVKFYRNTIAERKTYFYPPFSRLFELTVIASDQNEVNHLSEALFKLLEVNFRGRILGPEFPLVSRIKNKYHKRILIKTSKEERSSQLRTILFDAMAELNYQHKKWNYRVSIDVDPV